MYEDKTDSVSRDCSDFYGKDDRWHIYGGHRLWLSPEDSSTYYPDNGEVGYSVDGNTVVFTPSAWKKIDVQPSVAVTFEKDGSLTVAHSMKNLGETRDLCLWALTVMKSGGEVSLPLSTENTGFLANRNIVMWHYASFGDARFTLKDDRLSLKSSVSVPAPYKVGAYCDKADASYILSENGAAQVFTKTVFGEKGGRYPDFTCNFETYCTNLIHEIETLSPIKTVPNGGVLTHVEKWTVKKI
jgi:hypothetical protein